MLSIFIEVQTGFIWKKMTGSRMASFNIHVIKSKALEPSAPPETFPNVKYDVPEEVGGDRKCFDCPIRK